MHSLAKLDHKYVWHPFTQMRDWLKQEPIIIVQGRGAVVRDVYGREYLDANSSIWTNLHGHNHPKINTAIGRQFRKIAHSSALGLANEPASLLAHRLARAANPQLRDPARKPKSEMPCPTTKRQAHALSKVFFSDDGSTAVEVALKLAYEFAQRSGLSTKPRFLGLGGAYHGDTVGAVSVGHIDLFHKTYAGLLFKTDMVAAPYCYRCPFNRAKPERADARQYRKCAWECLGVLEQKFKSRKKVGEPYAALVFEPLIQGAAGMIPQPVGWLASAAKIARSYGTLLIADEVMTGFGRTGETNHGYQTSAHEALAPKVKSQSIPVSLFACHKEQVQPDFLVLAKGLTGGYLPMAATLTTKPVFDAFLGEYESFKTFFHGHSFTGNQLGAAAALASLELLQSQKGIQTRARLEQTLTREISQLWALPTVGDIRQVGLIAGVELVKDWRTREPFDLRERIGTRVCDAMAQRGVLTRPVGNVVVLMPPYCTTSGQVHQIVQVLAESIRHVAGREHCKPSLARRGKSA